MVLTGGSTMVEEPSLFVGSHREFAGEFAVAVVERDHTRAVLAVDAVVLSAPQSPKLLAVVVAISSGSCVIQPLADTSVVRHKL